MAHATVDLLALKLAPQLRLDPVDQSCHFDRNTRPSHPVPRPTMAQHLPGYYRKLMYRLPQKPNARYERIGYPPTTGCHRVYQRLNVRDKLNFPVPRLSLLWSLDQNAEFDPLHNHQTKGRH